MRPDRSRLKGALLPRAPASRLESHTPVTTWSSSSRWWRPEWASPRFPNRAQSAPGARDPHHRTRGQRPSDLCRHVRRPTRPTRHHRADRDPEGHGVVPHVPPGSRPAGCVRWRHRRTHATRPNGGPYHRARNAAERHPHRLLKVKTGTCLGRLVRPRHSAIRSVSGPWEKFSIRPVINHRGSSKRDKVPSEWT